MGLNAGMGEERTYGGNAKGRDEEGLELHFDGDIGIEFVAEI